MAPSPAATAAAPAAGRTAGPGPTTGPMHWAFKWGDYPQWPRLTGLAPRIASTSAAYGRHELLLPRAEAKLGLKYTAAAAFDGAGKDTGAGVPPDAPGAGGSRIHRVVGTRGGTR